MSESFEALENAIGYVFHDTALLRTALTHASFVNEQPAHSSLSSYERLEYLGDAVLQFVISSYLYRQFPDCDEGYLTQFRQQLVREETLARVANGLGIGDCLFLGNGERHDRNRPSLLSDAMEAIFAAVYLDGGEDGIFVAERVILRVLAHEIENVRLLRGGDYKTRILQLVQGDGEDTLSYEVVEESGPPHDRTFHVVARLNSNIVGHGTGKSKREAEQNAACEALALFGIRG